MPGTNETVNALLVLEGTIAAGPGVENRFLPSRLRSLQDTSINDPEQGASDSSCLAMLPDTNNDALALLASDTTYGPAYYYPKPPPLGPVFLALAKKPCIDCRRKGGTTTKPPYRQ